MAPLPRPAHRVAAVSCLEGQLGLGPNLAVALLELSEGGACLLVTKSLAVGDEVELSLEAVGGGPPVKALAEVVWSAPEDRDRHRLGVRFRRPLSYSALSDLVNLGE
jgi:hypothetical protein